MLIAPLTTLPGIYQHPVISSSSDDTLLDSMRLLSEQGVSSVAVVDPVGMLLSAISVRDIGRRVVPSPNKRILDMSLSNFITLIKAEDGATDGVDKFPGVKPVLRRRLARLTVLQCIVFFPAPRCHTRCRSCSPLTRTGSS